MPRSVRAFLLVNAAIFAVAYPALLAALWWNGGAISTHGWIAASVGIAATWWLAVGLMAAIFVSAREGHDERVGTFEDDDLGPPHRM